MSVISIYRDLDGEIEIIQTRIKDLQVERKILLQKMMIPHMGSLTANYSGMPGSPFTAEPLDKQYVRLREIESKLEELYAIMEPKLTARKEMQDKLKGLEGLPYKVFYMRNVERLRLDVIAERLDKSHDYIRHINAGLQKEETPLKIAHQ